MDIVDTDYTKNIKRLFYQFLSGGLNLQFMVFSKTPCLFLIDAVLGFFWGGGSSWLGM